jgi:hypothetical protein
MISALQSHDYDKALRQINHLLDYNEKDPYAWAGVVALKISEGIKKNAFLIIMAACDVKRFAEELSSSEEIEDLKDFIKGNIGINIDTIISCEPLYKSEIEDLLEWASN